MAGRWLFRFDTSFAAPYSSPVNSMTIYALGRELDRALERSTLVRVVRFHAAITLEIDGAEARYWHILRHAREPELVATRRELAPAELGAEEMAAAAGRAISEVRSLGFERVLLLTLEAGGEWRERGKLLLRIDLTPQGTPLSLFEAESGRILATIGERKGARLASPLETRPPRPLSILSLPESVPEELFAAQETEGGAAELPPHKRRWTKEGSAAMLLAERIGGLDPDLSVALSIEAGGTIDRMWPALREIGRRLSNESWDWRLYELGGRAGSAVLYPVELPIAAPGARTGGFARGLELRAERAAVPAYVSSLRRSAAARVRADTKRLERLNENLAGDLADAGRADEFRHFANLLVTHRPSLKKGMKSAVLRDFSGERDVEIPLDPARSIEANVRSYFTRAKKGEKGGLIIRNRKREVERSIGEQRDLLGRIDGMTEPSELLPLVPREGPAQRPRRESEAPERFRRFALDERHTVYVGRSDAENDILTHKFAAPGDLWFHAQGVPGSHVVLKGAHRSTSRAVIERTAAIAAYFSKARNSRTVPVIYTEKRHVRRPRKSKSGAALCTHEKTVFVRPAIPEEDNPAGEKKL